MAVENRDGRCPLNRLRAGAHLGFCNARTTPMASEKDRALDAYLAAGAAAGDRVLTRRLVARWTPRLSALAWRLLGHAEGVEDVVQDAWIEILKGVSRLRAVEAFPAFAFRITQRRCARRIRSMQADRRLEQAVEAEPAPVQDDPDHSLDAGKAVRAMAALPPDQHAALWLHHIEGLSVREIALSLDVPAGTVKTRLMHGRRKLAALLRGGDHE
jgi:RNA polymerase sigma-70 factor (ECF subfamily)